MARTKKEIEEMLDGFDVDFSISVVDKDGNKIKTIAKSDGFIDDDFDDEDEMEEFISGDGEEIIK